MFVPGLLQASESGRVLSGEIAAAEKVPGTKMRGQQQVQLSLQLCVAMQQEQEAYAEPLPGFLQIRVSVAIACGNSLPA